MAKEKSTMGLEENVASALCYVLVWVTGIIFFFMEKENKTVRFHAMQSILTFLPLTILGYIFQGILGVSYATNSIYGYTYGIPTLSPFYYVGILIYLVVFVLWLLLMFKAYKGEKFKLPVIGDIAEKHA
jgi:uncharacterized membrane protein